MQKEEWRGGEDHLYHLSPSTSNLISSPPFAPFTFCEIEHKSESQVEVISVESFDKIQYSRIAHSVLESNAHRKNAFFS